MAVSSSLVTSPTLNKSAHISSPKTPNPHISSPKAIAPHLPPDISSFLNKIIADHPQFTFKSGTKFAFHPPKTIILGPPQPNYTLLALHELAHALCKHECYDTHVQRIKIESEAWQKAKTLCQKYAIDYDEDFVEDQLDTYRAWLHAKSTCPTCGLTRFQTPDSRYHCPQCDLLIS